MSYCHLNHIDILSTIIDREYLQKIKQFST
jgi:hypothetical protein